MDLVRRVTRQLATLRKQCMTQEALAELLDVPVQHVSRIESGQNITLATLERIAIALGLSVDVQFERRGKPTRPPPSRKQKAKALRAKRSS